MRLPADATLIVVGAGNALRLPRVVVPGEDRVEANVARLIAAWRKERLPIVHLRLDAAPSASGGPSAAPLEGEIVAAAGAAGGFAGTGLESLLDDCGVTTLVLCGAVGPVEATARDAAGLGYHTFIPLDACWPAASSAGPAIARFERAGSVVVDTAAALAAAATAKARQRRDAERSR